MFECIILFMAEFLALVVAAIKGNINKNLSLKESVPLGPYILVVTISFNLFRGFL